MLAVIYVAIVRRVCEVNMDIIGLPGHIVVGVPYEEGDQVDSRVFVDPFDNGKILIYADCQEIVSRYNMTFNEEMVRPISNEQVWQRMVRNLIHSHSMQALAEDNNDDEEPTSDWKIAIPLRFLLSDYESRVRSFRDLETVVSCFCLLFVCTCHIPRANIWHQCQTFHFGAMNR